MDRRHFFVWSAVGAVLWATGLTLLGYALGGIDLVHDNLEAAILLIVAFSVLPIVVEVIRARRGHTASETIVEESVEVIDDVRKDRL